MSRFCYCNCPAGFGAGAERHAPDCPGRKLDVIRPTPVYEPKFIKPADFGANKPQIDVTGYQPDDFDPGYSAQRAALLELMQKTQREIEELREKVLLDALGMTREQAIANRDRITCQHHPDSDVYLVDGEPVVQINRTKFNEEAATVTYTMLRPRT